MAQVNINWIDSREHQNEHGLAPFRYCRTDGQWCDWPWPDKLIVPEQLRYYSWDKEVEKQWLIAPGNRVDNNAISAMALLFRMVIPSGPASTIKKYTYDTEFAWVGQTSCDMQRCGDCGSTDGRIITTHDKPPFYGCWNCYPEQDEWWSDPLTLTPGASAPFKTMMAGADRVTKIPLNNMTVTIHEHKDGRVVTTYTGWFGEFRQELHPLFNNPQPSSSDVGYLTPFEDDLKQRAEFEDEEKG